MAGYRWGLDVAAGKSAIWKGKEDRLPFDDPLNHLDRLLFHSALDYTQIIDTQIFNVNLPARTNAFTEAEASYPLYQHSKAGYPVILGSVPVNGQPCMFAGSIPIQQPGLSFSTSNPSQYAGYARFISLGVDATWVYVYEYCVNFYSNSNSRGQYPALTVPVTVFMTNELFE
jgi:hypothetical protein